MTTNTTNTVPNAARGSRLGDVAWMADGACLPWGDLPWTADTEQTTACQRRVMGAICQGCPVQSECRGFVKRAKVSVGFWAGRHRDTGSSGLTGAETLPGLGGLGGAA
jgi:hypothetical protein